MKVRGAPLFLSLLLAVSTFIVFVPVVSYQFVNFDDGDYVSSNLHVQGGLTWENVGWAFNGGHAANWHPLTWLSHMLDWEMFGPRAGGHHLVSVILHVLNSVLLFLLLRQVTGALWRSALVAALFALHPLHVESVAWISERKDVLSTFFFMLTIGAYAKYVEGRGEVAEKQKFGKQRAEIPEETRIQRRQTSVATAEGGMSVSTPKQRNTEAAKRSLQAPIFYLLSLFCFALGLLSKPMLVTVPFLLLLLDYWPLERGVELKFNAIQLRHWKSLVNEKIPFFILAGVSSVVTFIVQRKAGSVWSVADLPLASRIENTAVAYCRYLGKLFWPAKLSVFYPHPGFWPVLVVIFAAVLLVTISVLVLVLRRLPYLAVGWFWFIGTLVPVIGLVQVGWQSIADRYTYIPYIGIFIILVWLSKKFIRRWSARVIPLTIAGSVVLIVLAMLTRQQVGYWRDSEALFSHSLVVTEHNFVAHHNLGLALVNQGRTDEAITH